MNSNPILEELYRVRRQLMAEHGENLSAYLHSEFARLKAAGHPIADLKQRQIRRGEAANSFEPTAETQSPPPGNSIASGR